MSLLQNEDFVLYQLRTGYLANIKDGVGERLINVDTSVLNNPAFRAAGWTANNSDIKRTYSPPIPTVVTADYFQAPRATGVVSPGGLGDDEEEGGLVTGGGGSHDTVGPSMNARRRRRKEQLEEDDSSDLSDESDDEEGTQRPVTQIKFTKMPVRNRAGSSPLRSGNARDGPAVTITSPSRPKDSTLRRGSLGALEAVKARSRRDTVTSSEMSSENELDPSVFQRKPIRPSRPNRAVAAQLLSHRILEDERENDLHMDDADAGMESDGSTLSSEFAGTADTGSILGGPDATIDSSPPLRAAIMPASSINSSPRRGRPAKPPPDLLQALPPPRPISTIQPVSILAQALKAKSQKPESPFQRFATLDGKGDNAPLWLKIYTPFSKPCEVLELPVKKVVDETTGAKTTVAEALGHALWKYTEEGFEPKLPPEKMNVNRWVFRMYEDDEVEYDFPPLTRNKPIADFASNNKVGPGRRRQGKPWDEFALVPASDSEFADNEKVTPEYSKEAKEAQAGGDEPPAVPPKAETPTPSGDGPPTLESVLPAVSRAFHNPVLGPGFPTTDARGIKPHTGLQLDAPAVPTSTATPRTGAKKTILVHYTDDNFSSRKIPFEVTTDTYIAEIFEKVCRDLSLDKALFHLRISGSTTVAFTDRTVEALGNHTELDLHRRRFGDSNFGLSGSPGSSSPNAPLFVHPGEASKKSKKNLMHPLAQKQDAFLSSATNATYKRFYVTRKQPMSFATSSPRVLALDGEYMHIMPPESMGAGGGAASKALFETQAKTTTVPFSSVVGSKVSRRHPRMLRVLVYREKETKRYDFEARNNAEAEEIVMEIRKAAGL